MAQVITMKFMSEWGAQYGYHSYYMVPLRLMGGLICPHDRKTLTGLCLIFEEKEQAEAWIRQFHPHCKIEIIGQE